MNDYAPWRRWYVVFVLLLLYVLMHIDKQVLGLLVEPIRKDLGLTDTQISLLQGAAYSIAFMVMSVPFAALADRYNRKYLMAWGLAGWSVATALCGFAQSFFGLFAARLGVGGGEAALGPTAPSMIASIFPREQVMRALSIWGTGAYLGPGLGLVVTGAIITSLAHIGDVTLPLLGVFKPWQMTFIILGAFSIPVGLLLAFIREPERGPARQDEGTFAALYIQLKAHWQAYTCLIGGQTLLTLTGFTAYAWGPTVFIRVHGWSAAEIGGALGLAVVIGGPTSLLVGSFLAERLKRRGVGDAIPRVMSWGAAGCAITIFTVAMDNATVAFIGLSLFMFIKAMPFGVSIAGLQLITPDRLRGKVTTLTALIANMVGFIIGPVAVALITDYVFKDPQLVGYSLAIVIAASTTLAFFLLRWGRRSFMRTLAEADRRDAAIAPPTEVKRAQDLLVNERGLQEAP